MFFYQTGSFLPAW